VSRVLVTGATGFTARYVLPLLTERGHEVQGLSSRDCDIRDAVAVRDAVAAARPDKVIHLAGTPNVPDSQAELARTINVDGTVRLLEACERLPARPGRILLASSCYVYGDNTTVPSDERAPLHPSGAYGKSKLEMELAAARFAGRLPIVVVRPFNYTGRGHDERFLVPKLVRAFRQPSPDASFVAPDIVRDFSDVRWMAAVYAALLDSREQASVVNACSGAATPLPELVELLERLSGRRARLRPPAARAVRSQLVGSARRLRSLGIAASPYSLAATLQWMLDA